MKQLHMYMSGYQPVYSFYDHISMKRLLRFGITNRPMTTKRPMKWAIIEEIGAPLPHGAPHDRPMGRPKQPPQVLISPLFEKSYNWLFLKHMFISGHPKNQKKPF
jgi:hypothetical protein